MQRINNIELKFICVEILSEIDRVCAKYGLHYFANFGHNGERVEVSSNA